MNTYSKLAKFIADKIGHGMAEKCQRHAEIAEEYYQEEINTLKAQVETLRGKLEDFDAYENTNLDYRTSPFCLSVVGLLKKTPQQCLADVKADAILEAVKEISTTIQFSDDPPAGLNEYCEAVHEFGLYAQQLREAHI